MNGEDSCLSSGRYGVSFEGVQAPHAAHVRKKKIKAVGDQQGVENQHQSGDQNGVLKFTVPSSGENPHAENHRSMNKPFQEEGTGSPSAIATGEVEKEMSESVSEVASLPSGSTPTQPSLTGTSEVTKQAIQRMVNSEVEVKYIRDVLYEVKLEPNQSLLQDIFESQPDFVWSLDAAAAACKVLGTKFWKKAIKTRENFRYYWSKTGEKDLCAQIRRELPDPVEIIPDDFRCLICHKAFAKWEDFSSHTNTEKCQDSVTGTRKFEMETIEAPTEKHYLEGYLMPDSEPEPRAVPTCAICQREFLQQSWLDYHNQIWDCANNCSKAVSA